MSYESLVRGMVREKEGTAQRGNSKDGLLLVNVTQARILKEEGTLTVELPLRSFE